MNKFPRDGHRTEALGTNRILGMTATKWPDRDNFITALYTVFDGILNKPFVYDCYTVAFLEQPSFDSPDACEDKWLNKLNAEINSKHDPPPCEIILVPLCDIH